MPIRTLIVDDEPLARQTLRELLARDPAFELAGECAAGTAAVELVRSGHPDLVLLDIQMPELDGFGVIERIGVERMPPVVFVTAYDEYAVRAFEVQALDYLLKPFDDARFFQALARAREEIANHDRRFLSERLAGPEVENDAVGHLGAHLNHPRPQGCDIEGYGPLERWLRVAVTLKSFQIEVRLLAPEHGARHD